MGGIHWLMVTTNSHEAIGKITCRDIYSRGGVLLLPADIVVNADHVEILEKHGMDLSDRDVAEAGTYAVRKIIPEIEEAVQQAEVWFEEMRASKKVPLSEIRQDIIPMIHEVALNTSLFDLLASLQAKDDYTYRHNIAVGAISTLIGEWIGLDRQELLQLTTAGLLHDVGKMFVPQEILDKPEKLTAKEFAIMKMHTVYGYELLRNTVGISHRQALVALQHHERMDGSGYPLGIDKTRIDLFSCIVSIADVFHAMTSRRVYSDPSPFYEALYQMDQDVFGHLDPAIARVFMEKVMIRLIGQTVLLTDGREGKIVLLNRFDPLRPFIQIGQGFVNLSMERTLHIRKIL